MSRWLRNLFAIALLSAVVLLNTPVQANGDFATWHGLDLRFLNTDSVDLTSSAELRFFDDSRVLRQVLLRQAMAIDASRFLRFGVHYAYLPTRLPESGDWRDQHRLELEATPRWPVTERLTLDFRNRLDLRWIEGRSGLNERSRHRLQVTYALAGLRPVEAIYASNEFFFGYSGMAAWNQNWLVPLGAHFRFHKQVRFSLYYMIPFIRSSSRWDHAHVLGTRFAVSF